MFRTERAANWRWDRTLFLWNGYRFCKVMVMNERNWSTVIGCDGEMIGDWDALVSGGRRGKTSPGLSGVGSGLLLHL